MIDHREYVGLKSDFDKMSLWQFDFLTKNKLIDKNTNFLDLGCGCLRLGRILIPWLDSNCYTGLDYNEKILNLGIEKELSESDKIKKSPKFICTDNWDVSSLNTVDFIWAQAVFNHINLETIESCLKNLVNIINKDTKFYFTYIPGEYNPVTDDRYTFKKINIFKTSEQITSLFLKYNLKVKHTSDFTPLKQTICVATKI